MKLISTLFGIVIFTASLVFALSNRQSVSVSLWPFDLEMTSPLYILTLGTLAIGILIGGAFIWVGSLPHRFRSRRLGKDVVILGNKIQELEKELEQHRAREALAAPPLSTRFRWRFWERW